MQVNQQTHMEVRAMQEQSCIPSTLDLATLEVCCRSEIEHACLKDAVNAPFSFELLRRATSQDNQQAWEAWQRCVASVLRSWLRRHPRAEQVCHLGSEEGCLARTFECFRQAVAAGQLQACTSLPTMLRYLQACLNGVLLDALRSTARPKGIPLQELADPEEQSGGDSPNAHDVWVRIQALFPDHCAQRVVFFLFHCHLSQEEMFCFAPQAFRDVQEIHHLRHEMFQHIVHHACEDGATNATESTCLFYHPPSECMSRCFLGAESCLILQGCQAKTVFPVENCCLEAQLH